MNFNKVIKMSIIKLELYEGEVLTIRRSLINDLSDPNFSDFTKTHFKSILTKIRIQHHAQAYSKEGKVPPRAKQLLQELDKILMKR